MSSKSAFIAVIHSSIVVAGNSHKAAVSANLNSVANDTYAGSKTYLGRPVYSAPILLF